MRDFYIDQILKAYALGLFPMATCTDAPDYHWVRPENRGVIFIEKFHIPKSLKKFMAHSGYKITKDEAFDEVVTGCRETCETRKGSWINKDIAQMFKLLFKAGYAHSYECWDEKGNLIGGLYGLDMGKLFCGESMFSRKENASKSCLVQLYQDLKADGYMMIDTQFVNDHLKQFGVEEIPHQEFIKLCQTAIQIEGLIKI